MADWLGKGSRVREICQRLRPLIGEQADRLFAAYLAEDKEGKEQLEHYLETLLAEKLQTAAVESSVSLIPPAPEQAQGEYSLGAVIYGKRPIGPFGLREGEWIQHVGVFGRSGAGKTNAGYLILRQLQEHGKPFLMFDWKRNYRDLLALPEFSEVEVYTIGRPTSPLTFNPLIPPPGTPPKTWLKKIIEVIAHAYMLGNGVLFLLQESVDAVYQSFGIYDGTVTRYPTIRDVLEVAKSRESRGREAAWLSSTLRALSSLCFGDMDQLINLGDNHNLDELLTRPVILELDALTQSDKVFFIQALLLWIHHRRMIQGEREKFHHAILIEEAHHVLSGERRSLIGGQSIMEITFREIREFGESIVILDQHPSQISLPALGNTYTTICLNLKHSRDVSAMGQAMLLSNDERDILGNLQVGQAVVKLQGRATRPFLIEIPEFPVTKGRFTDAQVQQRMIGKVRVRQGLDSLPVSSGREESPLSSFMPAHQENATVDQQPASSNLTFPEPGLSPSPPVQSESIPPPPEPPESDNTKTDSIEAGFLRDIDDNPDSGVAARYKRLGISVRQGQKLKSRLATQNLITESLETTSQGTKRFIRLTEKGRQLVDLDREIGEIS